MKIIVSNLSFVLKQDADEIEYAQIYPEVVLVPDPEIMQENLVEKKHHQLTRSIRSGTMSKELKPNARKRDQLAVGYLYSFFFFLKYEIGFFFFLG